MWPSAVGKWLARHGAGATYWGGKHSCVTPTLNIVHEHTARNSTAEREEEGMEGGERNAHKLPFEQRGEERTMERTK